MQSLKLRTVRSGKREKEQTRILNSSKPSVQNYRSVFLTILQPIKHWMKIILLQEEITYPYFYEIYITSWRARRCPWKKIILKKKISNFFLVYNPPPPSRHPWVSTKNFSPIGPAVWPAIGNIYTIVLFYYIDLAHWKFCIASVKSWIEGCMKNEKLRAYGNEGNFQENNLLTTYKKCTSVYN